MAELPPANGSVIRYPYLWKWQEARGESEGRKSRPVCLVLSIAKGDKTHLVLLAVSGTPPMTGQSAIEVPQLERKRAGLRDWKDAWVTVSEYNYDILQDSYYLEPDPEILGRFSTAFLAKIAAAFRPFVKSQSARVERTGPA